MAKAESVAIGKITRDFDPFPALGANSIGFACEFLGDEMIEEGGILEPAARPVGIARLPGAADRSSSPATGSARSAAR